MADPLSTWNDGATKAAILDFVARVTDEAQPDYVPPAERVAVFDNDGTLWCEKPMPIEVGFILRRFVEMAKQDASLCDTQPWKAACQQDYAWLGAAMDKHYGGDDSDLKLLMRGILQAFAGVTVEDYATEAREFLSLARHPTLDRRMRDCGYRPMIELLGHLEANGFTNFIALHMLQYAGGPSRPALRLVVLHDDDEREFAYASGSEQLLERAGERAWTVASVKSDWATVFGAEPS
jgi:hypothetical protein